MHSRERRPSWGLVVAFAIVFAATVVAALLAGCAPSVTPPLPSREFRSPAWKRYDVNGYGVYEFWLDDGTRCVALSHAGGIVCEWQR